MKVMRQTSTLIALLLPTLLLAQPRFEIIEYTGIVKSIEPSYRFTLERLTLDVDGNEELFSFQPNYGEFLTQKVRVGDRVSVKVNVNVTAKNKRTQQDVIRQHLGSRFSDRIEEIKIDGIWYDLRKPSDEKDENGGCKVFLERKVKSIHVFDKFRRALVLDDDIAAFRVLYGNSKEIESIKEGDLISFFGFKFQKKSGYQFPVPKVKEAYTLGLLRKETGTMQALLFKQNHTCIGVKFETSSERDLMVSFPSERAMEVNSFLKPDRDLTIYYGEYADLDRNNLPELHAIIQGTDTLMINDFGFYGGPDSKHEHTEIDFEGKITRINKTKKGSIESLIVGSDFYVEIDAILAQQLGLMFQKGKQIKIFGRERVKKVGEIYSKNYRIVRPLKIIIDEKTFLSY